MPFLVPTNPVVTVSGTNPVISTGGVTPVITIQDATVEQKGAVQLEDSVSSDSVTKAATSKSVKEAYDYATTISGTLQTQIDGKSDTDHLHDDRYYTESEVDTISGSLNIAKSDVGHTHTESDITDLDKYTQAEVNTISGSLSVEIGSDISTHEAGDSHDSRYYTETELDNGQLDTRYYTEIEVDTISGTLRTNIDGKSGTDHLHDDRYYTETEVDSLITTISGKLDDHDELNNLDFASSGHTGFQPAGDYVIGSELTSTSGTLQSQIDGKSDTDHTHTESDVTDLDKYTQVEVDTISGTLNTKINGKDNYQSWTFQIDGVDKDDITSGDKLNFVGGDNIIITRSADDEITISGSEGVTNHSQLNELDYVSTGHTGFASTGDLTTVSGDLQTNIDDKSDVGHNHDDKYYTETELDNGQLDNRYYIESEIDTISGSLQTNIDGKSDISHSHDDRYYTETEINTISGALSSKIDSDISIHSSSGDHDDRYYTESEVDDLITTISGKLDDHDELNNLDYASSGHTGFAPTSHIHIEANITDLDKYTQVEIDTISGSLTAKIDSDISTHTSDSDAHHAEGHNVTSHSDTSATGANLNELVGGADTSLHIHDGRYYTESEVDSLITTISGKLDDHDELNNLDYANSGHTGFQSAGDYLTETEINTISGALSAEIDSDITIHLSDTTAVHGITDTSDLALKSGNINQLSDITSVGADVEAAVDGITPYIIATGETVTIDTDEQLNIVEGYQIDGTGSLEVNGDGSLNVNDGPNTGERDAIFTAADETKLDDIQSSADVTDAVNIGTSIHGVANKTTPINADKVPLIDTEDSNTLKTSTWTNIKAFLKTYFDTLYNKYVHPNHSGEVTSAADGAQTITNKQTLSATSPITLSNTPTVIAGAAPVIAIPAATNTVPGHATATHIQAIEANTIKNTYPSADATKVGYLSVTQAVDLDTMESDIATNNAKVTNANHTGEVTGSGALTITSKAVTLTKMNDMATASLLGRNTAGTGVPEVLTATQVRDILNIGQTSENLIKNSGFWACSRLSSLVNTGSALVSDSMAANNTADWTKSNCTLVFSVDHYVIDPSANYAYIRMAATLKPGHLYKVRFDIKDGTSAGVNITLRIDACSSETKTTTVAFVSEYFIFHAPLASNWIYLKFGTDPGGNIQIKNFSVYEYNPQFTSTYGADWHRITSTITAERICEDYTHCRGFYGMKLTKGVDTAEYYTFSSATPLPPEYAEVIGMTTVFGMYVYSVSAVDNVKIQIVDSAGTTESAFIVADTLTWIEISRSIASSITTHDIRVLLGGDTGDVAYISFCKYSLGDTIGDGNWSHPKNEIITLELYKDSPFFVANTWNDFAYWQSPQGDSGGAISAQIEAVMVEMYANDSASAATWAYFAAGPGGNTSWTFVLNLSGLVNDAPGWLTGWIHCHRDGRFYFDLEASGSGTFDLGRFRYKGIMVR